MFFPLRGWKWATNYGSFIKEIKKPVERCLKRILNNFFSRVFQGQRKIFHMLKGKFKLDIEVNQESLTCQSCACTHGESLFEIFWLVHFYEEGILC